MGFNSVKDDDAALVQSGFKKADRQASCLGGWSGLIGVVNIASGGSGGGGKESVRKRGGLVGWRSDVLTRSGTRG